MYLDRRNIDKKPNVASKIASNLFHYPYRNVSTMDFSTLTLEILKLLGFCFLKRRQWDDFKKSLLLLKKDKGCILLNQNLQIIEFSSILC